MDKKVIKTKKTELYFINCPMDFRDMKTGKKFIQNIQTELLDLKSKNVESSKLSSLTHYIHNNKNGVSEFYKNDAVNYLEKILTNSYPEDYISREIAEEALQYLLFK